MMSETIVPNAITMNSMINSCAEAGNPEAATLWLSEIINMRLSPDVVSYNSVVKAFCNARMTDKGVDLLDRMEHGQIKSTVVTYTNLITSCTRASASKNEL